jgi:glycosyl-4,4'-diaponeurosporenoate acyltransferase
MALVELAPPVAVLVDAAAWAVAGTAVGWSAHRARPPRFTADGPVTRLRRFEDGGRAYERVLQIKRWKQRLPEAGALFRGGVSKRALPGAAPAALARFAVETRRAEATHWALLALSPLFTLWNPPALAVVMVAYAVVANAPCIAVQRYNRARLARVLGRAAHRQGP